MADPFGFHIIEAVPEIDAQGMTEVDALMIGTYGISLPQMMENAGRSLAVVARDRFLGGNVMNKQVVILAGTGGNGGGALTAARRLAAWGAHISITLLSDAAAMTPVSAQQLAILKNMGIALQKNPAPSPDLIIDGLIGYSLQGTPQGRALELIHWTYSSPAPVLALDVPSGFDTRTGTLSEDHIRAKATLTLALPKRGLRSSAARSSVGDLYLADISVPPALYKRLSSPLEVAPFAVSDIVRITDQPD